jgi:hypothetical protein
MLPHPFLIGTRVRTTRDCLLGVPVGTHGVIVAVDAELLYMSRHQPIDVSFPDLDGGLPVPVNDEEIEVISAPTPETAP